VEQREFLSKGLLNSLNREELVKAIPQVLECRLVGQREGGREEEVSEIKQVKHHQCDGWSPTGGTILNSKA
jgi:hypothetical protein